MVGIESVNNHSKIRLAIIALHPNYYQEKVWIKLSQNRLLDVEVIYLSDIGINKNIEHQDFGTVFCWGDLLNLDKYKHIFLENYGNIDSDGLMLRVNPQLFNLVKKNRYDVILMHGHSTLSSLFALFSAKLAGVKVIWRGESTLKGDENSFSWKKQLKKTVLSKIFNACDVVMYSCTGNKDYLQYYGVPDSKLFSIPCAVDNDFFQSERRGYLGKKTEIRNDLGIKHDDFVVLFSARFISRKRPMDLLQAIKRINHDHILVLFVGDGPERSAMEEITHEYHIKSLFVGFVNQRDISKYYSISDIAIVISDYDPSPKAMNEAMNFELPIIVTDVVGTAHDLIKDSVNGFVVKVGDIDTIAEKIEYFNKNRLRTKAMGKRSLDIIKNWNFQEDAKGIEKAIQFVMNY